MFSEISKLKSSAHTHALGKKIIDRDSDTFIKEKFKFI